MLKNNSGKVLTVFFVIIGILLVTLTAVSLFFFQKETERRKLTELILQKSQADVARFENELKETKKEKFLLEEKNKEADTKINNLLDEVDLQKGLNEEIKAETTKLKEQLAKEIQDREALQKSIDSVGTAQDVTQMKTKLDTEVNLRSQAEAQVAELQQKITALEQSVGKNFDDAKNKPSPELAQAQKEVNLEKIEVAPPHDIPEGRVLSVDADTEFIILNLGDKDGIKMGYVMAVYRGKDYLGDVKITRVQPQMSAADFIPPFSSRQVRKNDQVVFKQ